MEEGLIQSLDSCHQGSEAISVFSSAKVSLFNLFGPDFILQFPPQRHFSAVLDINIHSMLFQIVLFVFMAARFDQMGKLQPM